MTKRHVSFPSINQFRNVVKEVRENCSYHGKPLPTIGFTGTVKLHGTNSAICRSYPEQTTWAQSRSNIITIDSDNARFAQFVEDEKISVHTLLDRLNEELHDIVCNFALYNLCVFGEWCGHGIQKGVAISSLPRMFVVFAACIDTIDYTTKELQPKQIWLPRSIIENAFDSYRCTGDMRISSSIRSIFDFKTWFMQIDFSQPEKSQNALSELTLEVEQCCPVGKAFDVEGVGEGIVWTAICLDSRYTFKVKGEKHSVSKVKTLASVDVEKVNSISEFVNNVLTESRLQQGISVLIEQGLPIDNVSTGPFLKWIGNDVLKEETDTLEESGLERKDVMPVLNREARNWFLRQII
jgi:hypothetical protein